MTVELVHWNPRRWILQGWPGRVLPYRGHVNNFGDLIGPMVVRGLLRREGVDPKSGHGRLLSVGSIMHLARDGDVIWGTGVNGKISQESYRFSTLDVRAVRGPKTREWLRSRDIDVPAVYGDPALLLPQFMPKLNQWAAHPTADVTVVPNKNDLASFSRRDSRVLDPQSPVEVCLERIARSRFVVGSSLHALVLADALGIPARGVESSVEPEFKYADYYLGTGRPGFVLAPSVDAALELGGESPIDWDPEPLVRAFPWDLFP